MNVAKWFVKFCAGDFSLDDAPQSGRPVEVGGDQIKTLTENNQCYREIADRFKISKSIVIGENEKRVFDLMKKSKWTVWPTQ